MHTKRYSVMLYIAMLAAQGVIIGLLERMIPTPFVFAPGAKLGLSNLVILMAIFTLPNKQSFNVLWIKLFVTTLLGGTVSTFLYSCMGSLLSYIGMLLVKKLGAKRVSLIGVSIIGGVLHNVGQLIVASTMAKTFTVLLYLPFLSMSGILAGFAVGLAGNFLLSKVKPLRLSHIEFSEMQNESTWIK